MTDLGAVILGHAEPVMFVFDLVLQLKVGTTLLQYKTQESQKSFCIGPITRYFNGKDRQVTHH